MVLIELLDQQTIQQPLCFVSRAEVMEQCRRLTSAKAEENTKNGEE